MALGKGAAAGYRVGSRSELRVRAEPGQEEGTKPPPGLRAAPSPPWAQPPVLCPQIWAGGVRGFSCSRPTIVSSSRAPNGDLRADEPRAYTPRSAPLQV